MRKYLLSLALTTITLAAQQKANWKIEYELPAKVKANFETTLNVKLSDAQGKPIAGAEVETILTMVDMDHGEFKQNAKPSKPGIYSSKHNFIMVGSWQIEVRAKKGSQAASQKFRYEVKE